MAAKKKKKTRAKKKALRFLFLGVTSTAIVAVVFITLTHVWLDIYQKYKEKQELEEKLLKLKATEEELTVDVEKLQDPEYVARYLREKYFYSKNGEYIIKIPKGSAEK